MAELTSHERVRVYAAVRHMAYREPVRRHTHRECQWFQGLDGYILLDSDTHIALHCVRYPQLLLEEYAY